MDNLDTLLTENSALPMIGCQVIMQQVTSEVECALTFEPLDRLRSDPDLQTEGKVMVRSSNQRPVAQRILETRGGFFMLQGEYIGFLVVKMSGSLI